MWIKNICVAIFFFSDDYYDRDYLVDQFRKHYENRRQPIFRSRDAVYHPVSHPKNGRNDYHQGYPKLFPQNVKQQWNPRGFVAEAETEPRISEVDRSETLIPNDAIEDLEIGDYCCSALVVLNTWLAP